MFVFSRQITLARISSSVALVASLALTPIASHATLLSSDYMLGSWFYSHGSISFLQNGTYALMESGPTDADGLGFSGMEVGTYAFTPLDDSSGHIAFTTQIDTNGTWGTNGLEYDFSFYNNSSGEKCFTVEGTELCTQSTLNSPLLVNSWYSGTGVVGDISLLSFFSDGTYLHGIDPPTTTLEAGTYTWDEVTGILSLSNVSKFGGSDPTLSELGNIQLTIVDNQLRLNTTEGQFNFAATPISAVPEPSTFGLGIVGAFTLTVNMWRRRLAIKQVTSM